MAKVPSGKVFRCKNSTSDQLAYLDRRLDCGTCSTATVSSHGVTPASDAHGITKASPTHGIPKASPALNAIVQIDTEGHYATWISRKRYHNAWVVENRWMIKAVIVDAYLIWTLIKSRRFRSLR
ncbi:hypothetical protein AVEN_162746-1 [Araneus ventricosus]|uniref:Uncharacterized protein n=1 Tax=Araneus ventricosus TaxID=182803 RepID=A0A4Y2NQ30_ARAVE|nr:hypothetical protein AVEN_162746-1 [Araneus ventricosus]